MTAQEGCNMTAQEGCSVTAQEGCSVTAQKGEIEYCVLPTIDFEPLPEAGQTEMQEESFPLYPLELVGDCSPFVDIRCFGIWTRFLVDTGSALSYVNPRQREIWGRHPEEDCDYMDIDMNLKGTTFRITVNAIPMKWNILGLDILYRFNCLLDLETSVITFRECA
ncbi:uncharacterized protein LOC122244391 [Penaeus japonicus]|uniref:uncharacterized protein LOC122244391 n=1 Tax=Penaeus japonicus TaxID=27405 RepID=UPI001C714ED7|nr:uncharacterized protein LOC122244391 [Penaeus japonicus]